MRGARVGRDERLGLPDPYVEAGPVRFPTCGGGGEQDDGLQGAEGESRAAVPWATATRPSSGSLSSSAWGLSSGGAPAPVHRASASIRRNAEFSRPRTPSGTGVTAYSRSPSAYGRSQSVQVGRAWQCTHQNAQCLAPGATA